MSIHLVGGGWDGDGSEWQSFVAAGARRAALAGRAVPRIGAIAVRAGDGAEHAATLAAELNLAGPVELRPTWVELDDVVAASALDDVDAILIGGGLTPAYRRALWPLADRIRARVASGVPYAGFSAGSMLAADAALLGGWLHRGVPVADEETAEDLGELTIEPGFGLVAWTVDVHAAQWGTLARLITAVGDGLVPRGVAIDEHTALVVDVGGIDGSSIDGDRVTVEGRGNVWWVDPIDVADARVDAPRGGVRVRRQAAGA